jgi:hypothetical protein
MSEPNTSPGQSRSEAPQGERRAYVRLASDLASTCRLPGGAREVGWPGRVRDISLGGVGLVMRHCFRPGTELEIELRGRSGEVLRTVAARVVHATAVLVDGNSGWLLGCALDRPLSEEEFHALR